MIMNSFLQQYFSNEKNCVVFNQAEPLNFFSFEERGYAIRRYAIIVSKFAHKKIS